MELHADDRQLAVAHGHHLAVVGVGGRLELVGQPRRRERVVAARVERLGQAGEEAGAVVAHRARLAVQQLARVADLAAERLDDRLVAEADAERRRRRREPADDLDRRAGVRGPAGTGGDDELRRREPFRVVRGDLVVPQHLHVDAERAEEVREVVRERVVVVDQEHHRSLRLRELDRALERGELVQAFLVLGRRVGVGDDPAARLEIRDAVAQHERPDRDARVERALLREARSRPRPRTRRGGSPRAPR